MRIAPLKKLVTCVECFKKDQKEEVFFTADFSIEIGSDFKKNLCRKHLSELGIKIISALEKD